MDLGDAVKISDETDQGGFLLRCMRPQLLRPLFKGHDDPVDQDGAADSCKSIHDSGLKANGELDFDQCFGVGQGVEQPAHAELLERLRRIRERLNVNLAWAVKVRGGAELKNQAEKLDFLFGKQVIALALQNGHSFPARHKLRV